MIRATVDAALVTDIDLRFSGGGKAYARLRAVSKERKKDAQGKWVDGEETFFSVVVFGKPAEMLAESNPAKGTRLLIDGTMKMESWEDKEGNPRSGLSMIANNIALDLTFTAYDKRNAESASRGAAQRQDAVDDGWQRSAPPTSDAPW